MDTLNNLKAELIEKFAKDGVETSRTVAALVGVDKDFGNGKVAVTYVPLLSLYTTKEGFFVDFADLGSLPQSTVTTREQVEQWRTVRNELFGEVPKGILKAMIRRDSRPEDTAYLMNASRIGRELNKTMRVSDSYPNS